MRRRFTKLPIRTPLTGLGNRAAYVDLLNRYEREQREGRICCIMIDLNNLKTVNDSRGHHMGDIFLKMAADALRQAFTGRRVSIFRNRGRRIFYSGGGDFRERIEEMPGGKQAVYCRKRRRRPGFILILPPAGSFSTVTSPA